MKSCLLLMEQMRTTIYSKQCLHNENLLPNTLAARVFSSLWRVFRLPPTWSRISHYSTDDHAGLRSKKGAGAFWISVSGQRTWYVRFLNVECRWRGTNTYWIHLSLYTFPFIFPIPVPSFLSLITLELSILPFCGCPTNCGSLSEIA